MAATEGVLEVGSSASDHDLCSPEASPLSQGAHSRRLLIQDSLGYLLSKGTPGLFGLISVPIFVRLIGLEEYGRLSVVMPILMALSGAGSGWLAQGILRFHPAPNEFSDKKSAFHRAVSQGTLYSLAVVSLVLAAIMVTMHYSSVIIVAAELYCVLQLAYTISLTRFQAELRPLSVFKNEALRSSAGFVLPTLAIVMVRKTQFCYLLFGLAFGYAFPLLLTMTNSKSRARQSAASTQHSSLGNFPKSDDVLMQLWSFGWAIGLWLMLCQVLPIIGRSFIQKYSGYAQAGVYASMYELAVRAFSFFAFPVTQAAHPRIMHYWNQGHRAAARSTIRDSIKYQILMFLPLELLAIIFARPLTALILGANSRAPSSVLPTLLLGGFLWQIALMLHKPLEIMHRTKIMLAGMVAVLLIEFTGNYLLVPRFGIFGAVSVFVCGALTYIAFVAHNSRQFTYAGSAETKQGFY